MELSNIKIISVSETKSGKSTTTGKPWASKNILLGFEDETGESYISAVVDENVWNSLGFAVGQNRNVEPKVQNKEVLHQQLRCQRRPHCTTCKRLAL